MSQDNRRRALSETVSLDAWHKGFTARRSSADLCVDVVFTTGRIGEGTASDIRFKLELKRAEVVVIVPPTEPAAIDRSSVRRDAPQKNVHMSDEYKSSASGGIKLSGGVKHINPIADLNINAQANRVREHAMRISTEAKAMQITQVQTSDGDYAWLIESTIPGPLNGRPWDAAKQPRLKIIDKRIDRTKSIERCTQVELRCRREDLIITDITHRDENFWASLASDPFGKNKLIAAEAIIRSKLFEAGLAHGDLRDPYSKVTLCAIIADAV